MTVDAGDKAAAEIRDEDNAVRRGTIARAQQARVDQSRLKARMKSGEVDDLELLRGNITGADQQLADGMRLGPLLYACRGVGEAKRQQILEVFIASPRTKLKQLSYERRGHLAKVVRGAREIDV